MPSRTRLGVLSISRIPITGAVACSIPRTCISAGDGGMGITHGPRGEGPREKLVARGASALSEAELLAIILRTGVKGKSAIDLGRDMLQSFGGLWALLSADVARLREVKGIGLAKAVSMNPVLQA